MGIHGINAKTSGHDDIEPAENVSADFVLLDDIRPPPRIELARERMLLCRLYLGLIQTLNDDYGAEFSRHSDSATFRTIGIYVFLRTVMCSPVRSSTIAHVLKMPRAVVLKLNSAIVEALASPDIRKRFDDIGLEAKSSTPEAFGKFLLAETKRWGALLKKP